MKGVVLTGGTGSSIPTTRPPSTSVARSIGKKIAQMAAASARQDARKDGEGSTAACTDLRDLQASVPR